MSDDRGLPPRVWEVAESDRFPPRVRRANRFALMLVEEFQRCEVGLLAAAVTYYAFLSLIPLALLSVAVASFFDGGVLSAAILDALGNMLSAEGASVLESAVTSAAGRGGATVVSLGVLLWGGLRVFRGLDKAISRVYGSRPGGIVEQVRDGVVVLVAVGLGFVGMGLSGSVVSMLPFGPAAGSASVVVVWVVLLVAFVPLYAVLPDSGVGVAEALPGAAVAATSFTLLGTLFGVYASFASRYALYGYLGAVLLLLAWLNFAATALIGGAVVNAVLAGKTGRHADDGR